MILLRKSIVLHIFLFVWAISHAHPIWAERATGVFNAQQSCPAYVSKNRSTNPDNKQILAGNQYDIIEVIKPNRPDWYRVILPTANPKERWVSATCGQVQMTSGASPGTTSGENDNNNSCNMTGQADSYVLALSWQPAFCETKPQKPECDISDPHVYQARHFTLHGLWPNKKRCGTNYAFCGEVTEKENDFCDYPAIQLDSNSQSSLAEVMPSVTAGSCLERHEWHKHGTCQDKWPLEEYFDVSVDLTRQFNDSGMAYFMNRRIGQQVRTEDFLNRVTAVLGSAARQRIKLKCDRDMLVEIQLSLVADLRSGADLEKLITNAPTQGQSNCGETFRVDAIGQ